jgi:stage V sporulation protein SpoVS
VTVSLARYFRTLRHAPVKRWPKLLRRWMEGRLGQNKRSVAEECVFDSLQTYEKRYAQLAHYLGAPERLLPPNELEFLRQIESRPRRYPGAIGSADARFLSALTSILRPPHAVEIGTLTGFSAALIAAAIARRYVTTNGLLVDTIDAREQCLIDETRPTGFEIAEIAPELAGIVRLHAPCDSQIIGQLAHREELRFVFIDANHCHPYPLLDLLRCAPYTRPEGWVVLHDIQLGISGRENSGAASTSPFGAEWLFEAWPFRKISGDNIGAVQLPVDRSRLIPFALRLMSLPFEVPGPGAARLRSALLKSLAGLV